MKNLIIIILILAGIGIVALLIGEDGLENIRRGWENVTTNDEIAYLSCDEMPTVSEVESAMYRYSSEITDIRDVPGVQEVKIGDWTEKECPGKGKLVIIYDNNSSWALIKDILNGDTFHDIPYDLVQI